ncbi:hypothetical protein B296_00015406 [Ensete ventricosum]|uniref:Uncharacterized protein n=1 Tax=Ensete ventricosum TaxID=4639 RepID=A0A427AQ26_ENSVE|nr:hypothetical protein B296_00015406 [Ensete ventricosum]
MQQRLRSKSFSLKPEETSARKASQIAPGKRELERERERSYRFGMAAESNPPPQADKIPAINSRCRTKRGDGRTNKKGKPPHRHCFNSQKCPFILRFDGRTADENAIRPMKIGRRMWKDEIACVGVSVGSTDPKRKI